MSLRGRRLQVVVKAAYVVLQPGEAHEGVWHMEGLAHERIAANGVVYLSASPSPSLSPTAVDFRRSLRTEELERIADTYSSDDRGGKPPFKYRNVCAQLMAAPTAPGSALVFPNNLQHKLEAFRCAPSADPPADTAADTDMAAAAVQQQPGVRKMLCFFLVGAAPVDGPLWLTPPPPQSAAVGVLTVCCVS